MDGPPGPTLVGHGQPSQAVRNARVSTSSG